MTAEFRVRAIVHVTVLVSQRQKMALRTYHEDCTSAVATKLEVFSNVVSSCFKEGTIGEPPEINEDAAGIRRLTR